MKLRTGVAVIDTGQVRKGGFEGPIAFSDMQDKTTRGSQKSKIEYVECESDNEEQEVALTLGLRSG